MAPGARAGGLPRRSRPRRRGVAQPWFRLLASPAGRVLIMLYLGDCLEEMKKIESGSVDMVLCDLPYGTTQNKWDIIIPLDLLWIEYKRICKGVLVFTASQPFTSVLIMSNQKDFSYDWSWKKSRITGVLNAKRQPVRNHESIVVFCAKNKTYNPQGLIRYDKVTKQGGNSDNYGKRSSESYVQEFTNYPRSVLEIPSEGSKLHPTQKPLALLEYLIRTYTNKNDTVLDNTMGSGSTCVACVNTGRKFIGIEKDPTYFAIAERRIAESQSLAVAAE